MSSSGFTTLLNKQNENVEFTEGEILKLEKFKNDYNSVISAVTELQKSVSKTAFLPFSRKALVPGKLIHTNELFVYLGGTDDYFSEMSVYETVKLLKRRISKLDMKINDMKKQKSLLQDRIAYTKELVSQKLFDASEKNLAELGDDKETEIREEYNSDNEIEWRKKHTESRMRERKEKAGVTSPKLKNLKVKFDLDENFDSSDSSSSETNNSVIMFRHSNIPSPITRTNVTDLNTLTVAESVNLVALGGDLKFNTNKKDDFTPFGDITERVSSNVENVSSSVKSQKVSKFRSSRMSNK